MHIQTQAHTCRALTQQLHNTGFPSNANARVLSALERTCGLPKLLPAQGSMLGQNKDSSLFSPILYIARASPQWNKAIVPGCLSMFQCYSIFFFFAVKWFFLHGNFIDEMKNFLSRRDGKMCIKSMGGFEIRGTFNSTKPQSQGNIVFQTLKAKPTLSWKKIRRILCQLNVAGNLTMTRNWYNMNAILQLKNTQTLYLQS